MSRVIRIGFVRLLSLLGSSLASVYVFAAVVAGCTSPSVTDTGNKIASGSSSNEPSAPSAPRFVPGGPDSEDYGASQSYPIGDRSTFFQIPFLVGSQSHLDQIFEGRVIRRVPAPSRLARVNSEPTLRYEFEGATRTLDDYLARNPATGLLIARGETILIERYNTAATIGIASPRGPWPRPSPPCWSASQSRRAISARWTISPPPMCPRSPTPSMGTLRSAICSRCPRACASSRNIRDATMSPGSPPTRFGRSVPAASMRSPRTMCGSRQAAPGSTTPRLRPKCSASCYGVRLVARSRTTCKRRSGRRSVLKPTPLAHRPLGPGGDLLLHQRGAARLCAARLAAR